jgi:hypothetical protein
MAFIKFLMQAKVYPWREGNRFTQSGRENILDSILLRKKDMEETVMQTVSIMHLMFSINSN